MKKSALRFFIVCGLLLSLTSCFWFESFDEEKFSEKMNTWLAHNEYMLYEFWGTPSKSITYPDGTKVLTYIYEYTEKVRDGWWEDRNPPPPPPPKEKRYPNNKQPKYEKPRRVNPPSNESRHPNVRPPRDNSSNKMAPPSYEKRNFNMHKFQIQPLHYRADKIYHPPIYKNYSCQISFTVEKGIVTRWSYDGQNAALRRFIKRAPFIVEIKENNEVSMNDILNNRLNLWVGHSRIELLKIYGTNFKTELVDNGEILTFSDGISCEVKFRLDTAGVIKSFSYRGELAACERFIK